MSGFRSHSVISAGFRAIAATRADLWLAPLARGRGLILTFHHVRPPRPDAFQPNRLLEITPAFLDRVLSNLGRAGYEIVAMDDVPGRLARGGRPFAALTFDDGYRDNLQHAAPVLERHGAPWTIFVTTDYLSGRGRLWWLELEEVVRRRSRLALPGGGPTVPANTPDEKERAFGLAYRTLRAGPEEALLATLAGWCAEDGIDPAHLVRDLCLDWDELAALARRPGVTIGAHTLTHAMLAKHGHDFARREMEESRALVAERLGVPVRHLSYPVGSPTEAGPREFATARELGFATAVTTRPGHLFACHADHLTALPRVSVNGLYQSEAAITALVSGVPFLAWNKGRRLHVS